MPSYGAENPICAKFSAGSAVHRSYTRKKSDTNVSRKPVPDNPRSVCINYTISDDCAGQGLVSIIVPCYHIEKMSDYSHEIVSALRRIMRAVDLHSRRLLRTYGLTHPQVLILQQINWYPGITPGALAKALSLSQATITSIADRLERHGFLTRERQTGDKRKVSFALTQKGLDIISTNPSALHEPFIKKYAELEKWEQTLLLSSLQRVATMMESNDELEPYPSVDTKEKRK